LKAKVHTYDCHAPHTPRGLDGVVAGQTNLSHVDGKTGELIIGGYELKELAGRVCFEEAAHLLWRGALPASEVLAELRREIAALRTLPEETTRVLRAAAARLRLMRYAWRAPLCRLT